MTLYSGDLSIKVTISERHWVHSAFSGNITFTRTDGREFSAPTGPLYLAAAERQGVPIVTEPGYGYYA